MKKWFYIVLCMFLCTKGFSQNTPQTVVSKKWTLQECLDYAEANNITVQQSILDTKTAELNYKQSKNNKLPSVSASASQSFANGSSIDPITSNFVNKFVNSNSFDLNSSFTLYNGGTLKKTAEKNALLVDQSNLYLQEAKNSITLSLVQAYVEAMYKKEAISLAENSVTSILAESKRAEKQFKLGAIAKKDWVDVEAQLAQNKYNVVQAENDYALQLLTIKQLLELDPSVDFQLDIPNVEGLGKYIIPEKSFIYQNALNTLPDVKIFDVQKASSEKDLEIAKAGFLPTISLGLGVGTGYTSTQQYNYFRQLNGNLSEQLSLSLNIPIFSKFSNKTNVALAKINLQSIDLDKISAQKTLYKNIETAWLNASTNQGALDASKNAMETAELAFDLSKKKYEFGALTSTELLVSQNSYIEAQTQYVQTKYMAVLYHQLLNFYQGNPININE